jgi:predicted TPR repeat methyltransferase
VSTLAYAQIKLNDLPGAAGTYEAISRLTPRDIDALFKLATLYEGAGDVKKAKETYERILELDPDNEKAAEARLKLALQNPGS